MVVQNIFSGRGTSTVLTICCCLIIFTMVQHIQVGNWDHAKAARLDKEFAECSPQIVCPLGEKPPRDCPLQKQCPPQQPSNSQISVSAARTARISCDPAHSSLFLGRCFCHPGYAGTNCDIKSAIPNPHWPEAIKHCPNLQRDITYSPETDDNHNYYLCYVSSSGVTQIPIKMWKVAQKLELDVWKEATFSTSGDRPDDHIKGFNGYKNLNTHTFGNTLEIGSGPWTQLRYAVKAIGGDVGLTGITLLEPNGENYKRSVATCAYKNGSMLGLPVRLLSIGGEELSIIEEMDTVISLNVLDHVQDALKVLQNMYNALKPGGVIIWNDRWYDSPAGCREKFDRFETSLHPMRPKFVVFEHFISQFETISLTWTQVKTETGRECDGGEIYFVGRKRA